MPLGNRDNALSVAILLDPLPPASNAMEISTVFCQEIYRHPLLTVYFEVIGDEKLGVSHALGSQLFLRG
ncbi:CPS_collapsed_G0016990.mRNA.1.CDS.1 [Saccharomyces cerevisiae]|nr:CPS_collapsed_G0016990.mRNA.1.CDS.1 [Saccharomyces cerevisiae]